MGPEIADHVVTVHQGQTSLPFLRSILYDQDEFVSRGALKGGAARVAWQV